MVDSRNISRLISTTFDNRYTARPTPQGIAANNGSNGKYAAFLAIIFGLYQQTLYAQANKAPVSIASGNDPLHQVAQCC